MKILVTGAAGFIGYHVASPPAGGWARWSLGIDNLNGYYDPRLKRARLALLANRGFRIRASGYCGPGGDGGSVRARALRAIVIHLAAQPGVRHSIEHPHDYASIEHDRVSAHPRRLPAGAARGI